MTSNFAPSGSLSRQIIPIWRIINCTRTSPFVIVVQRAEIGQAGTAGKNSNVRNGVYVAPTLGRIPNAIVT